MQTAIPRPKVRERARFRQWRILAGTVALGATALGIASSAAPASATDPYRDTITVECTTGIVTQGDVQMSAMTVAKIPASALPDVPGGCVAR